MIISLVLLTTLMLILLSKKYYHWQYLKEVDKQYKNHPTFNHYSKTAIESMQFRLPEFGKTHFLSIMMISHTGILLISPLFFSYKAVKHTDLARFQRKLVYYHLLAFDLCLGLLLSIWFLD